MTVHDSRPTQQLKQSAIRLGFESAVVIPAKESSDYQVFRQWLNARYHAGMVFLERHREARRHPSAVLPGVKSILVLAVAYAKVLCSEDHPVQKISDIAEYARGVDYHVWIRKRLRLLAEEYRQLFPQARCRGAVDTAPLSERQLAVEAGLGWRGKNTLLLTPQLGSKIFLAELLSTAELAEDAVEQMSNRCGTCRLCLDACPTGALVEPGVLDARRCLNYWTIEHQDQETIPEEIRTKIGRRFFGCDSCQDVCPWNKNLSTIPEGDLDPRSLDSTTLRRLVAGSPLERRYR